MVTSPYAARCPGLVLIQDFPLVVEMHVSHDAQGFYLPLYMEITQLEDQF